MTYVRATAFAPASVGNVGVGFDVLGHAFPAIGDRVTACRIRQREVRIAAIRGLAPELPHDAALNTAGVAVQSLCARMQPDFGIELSIEKGIPLGSGLGGSAASAVAAVVAANELLDKPLPRANLLEYAVAGESVSSGSPHADNVAPSLLGGLVLTVGQTAHRIPVPASIRCGLVHPHRRLDTRAAREMLAPNVPLGDHVRQSARLAGLIAGCWMSDLGLIRSSLQDAVIEPQRARLIPGFASVKAAALAADALGCSISGAGPSVFAWCEAQAAPAVLDAMRQKFEQAGVSCDGWICEIGGDGADIEARE